MKLRMSSACDRRTSTRDRAELETNRKVALWVSHSFLRRATAFMRGAKGLRRAASPSSTFLGTAFDEDHAPALSAAGRLGEQERCSRPTLRQKHFSLSAHATDLRNSLVLSAISLYGCNPQDVDPSRFSTLRTEGTFCVPVA